MQDGFYVTGFFYNPNIEPKDEYEARLKVALGLARELKFDIINGSYDHKEWLENIRGLEGEPEGGERCLVCYRMRLEKTYGEAKRGGFDYFATTLSISPQKNSKIINKIGSSIGPLNFVTADFKKEDGFKKASDFARSRLFYRQNYCGCSFSQRKPVPPRLKNF